MGRVQDRISAALAAEVESRTEWDEPPALCFLYLEAGEPVLRQVPVPDAMWALDRPPQVLDRMSRCLGDFDWLLRSSAPEGLHGAVFRCEAWTVETPPPGSPGHEEAARMSRAHQLHLHPRRVEERSAWAVDRAGIAYGAMLVRGKDSARMQVAYPGPGRKRITGTIPEALERIVASVLGVTIRLWRSPPLTRSGHGRFPTSQGGSWKSATGSSARLTSCGWAPWSRCSAITSWGCYGTSASCHSTTSTCSGKPGADRERKKLPAPSPALRPAGSGGRQQ